MGCIKSDPKIDSCSQGQWNALHGLNTTSVLKIKINQMVKVLTTLNVPLYKNTYNHQSIFMANSICLFFVSNLILWRYSEYSTREFCN